MCNVSSTVLMIGGCNIGLVLGPTSAHAHGCHGNKIRVQRVDGSVFGAGPELQRVGRLGGSRSDPSVTDLGRRAGGGGRRRGSLRALGCEASRGVHRGSCYRPRRQPPPQAQRTLCGPPRGSPEKSPSHQNPLSITDETVKETSDAERGTCAWRQKKKLWLQKMSSRMYSTAARRS